MSDKYADLVVKGLQELDDTKEELDRVETSLRNLVEFVWTVLFVPACKDREELQDGPYCNVHGNIYCDQSNCPQLQAFMRRS